MQEPLSSSRKSPCQPCYHDTRDADDDSEDADDDVDFVVCGEAPIMELFDGCGCIRLYREISVSKACAIGIATGTGIRQGVK